MAIWALLLTVANALVALLQYVRTVHRSVRVRDVASYSSITVEDMNNGRPEGESYFSVDILSTGAAIWDLEVALEALVPAKLEDGQPSQGPNRLTLWLSPSNETNPLNSGQAMTFRLRRSVMARRKWGNGMDNYKGTAEELAQAPLRYVSLVVYCAGRRQKLKRVRSRQLHWSVQTFFGIDMGAKPPLRNALYLTLFHFAHGRRGDKIRRWVEKWRPGTFDMAYGRLSRLLSGERVPD